MDGTSPPSSRPVQSPFAAPTDIRAQMPGLAQHLRALVGVLGEDAVRAMVRTAVALRNAVDADDYECVNALFRAHAAQTGRVWWREAGYELGVGDAEMHAFAERHRAARRAAHEEAT